MSMSEHLPDEGGYGNEYVCRELEEESAWNFLMEQIEGVDPAESIVEYFTTLKEEGLVTAEQCYYFACKMRRMVNGEGEYLYNVDIKNETPEMREIQEMYMYAYNIDISDRDNVGSFLDAVNVMYKRDRISLYERDEIIDIVTHRMNE